MSDTHYKGRCLCADVTISVLREGATTAVCHCTHCQRQTSGAFSPVLLAPIGNIEVSGLLKSFDDTNDRGDRVTRMFCPNCGSPVLTKSVNDEAVGLHVVKAGILDGGAPAPTVEVFARSRRDWLPDLTTLRRFEAAASG